MKRTIAICVLLCLIPLILHLVPWQDVLYENLGTTKVRASIMGSFVILTEECDVPPLDGNAEFDVFGQAIVESGVKSGWFEIRRKRFRWLSGAELKITLIERTD